MVRTRAALREALTALAGEQSFESMTVRAIAARAGIGYATFFRHYKDKEALLSDVADQEITELLVILTPLLTQRHTLETARALTAFVEERLAINRALLAGGAGQVVREALLLQSLRRVSALRTRQEVRPLDELVLFHSVSATLAALAWWLRQEPRPSPEWMAQKLDALVLRPSTALQQGEG